MPAAKLESYYKGEMVKAIKKAGGYARRIEDQFAVGVLDLVFKMPDLPVIFAEAKRFSHLQFALSPRQWEEMRRVVAAGGVGASIGVKVPSEQIHIYGLPKDKDGKIYAKDCVVQQPGETFVALLQRWYGEQNADGHTAAQEREQHPSHGGDDSDVAAGEPTRGSGRQLPDDWKYVE